MAHCLHECYLELQTLKYSKMENTKNEQQCAIHGVSSSAKYLIEKRHFFDCTAYYVYRKNWLGKFKLIMHDNNNGVLKTLEAAKDWINKMEFKDYTSEKHYY
jgi:hypothetical protein